MQTAVDEPSNQTIAKPYTELPSLRVLLHDIDEKHSRTLLSRSEKAQLIIFIVSLSLLVGFLYLWLHWNTGWIQWCWIISGVVLFCDGIWVLIASLFMSYWKWQSEYVSSIEEQYKRERNVIHRLKHIPPAALRGLRERVKVEIDFSSKAQFISIVGLIISIFLQLQPHSPSMAIITINGMAPEVSSVKTEGFSSWSAALFSAVVCVSFFEVVMSRLNRNLRRVVHVLECAESVYSSHPHGA